MTLKNFDMTQEEKELLLKDLCARLPYGFTIYRLSDNANLKINDIDDFAHFLEYSDGEEFKPYLRSMSSMTEEEKDEVKEICADYLDEWENAETVIDRWKLDAKTSYLRSAFYNSHHLDWNGLIEKGLALKAPEDMYKIE